MKKLVTIMLMVVLLMVCSSATFARTYSHRGDHLFLDLDYSLPYNNVYQEGSFSYGAGFRFWGVFFMSAMYYEKPEFLTCGVGMKIPMGGFGLVGELGGGYNVSNEGAIFDFCDTYKLGLELDLTDSVGLQIYRKWLTDFTLESGVGTLNLDYIGAGIVINF